MNQWECYRCDQVFNEEVSKIHAEITKLPIREEIRR
jgi:hypothetical protein